MSLTLGNSGEAETETLEKLTQRTKCLGKVTSFGCMPRPYQVQKNSRIMSIRLGVRGHWFFSDDLLIYCYAITHIYLSPCGWVFEGQNLKSFSAIFWYAPYCSALIQTTLGSFFYPLDKKAHRICPHGILSVSPASFKFYSYYY